MILQKKKNSLCTLWLRPTGPSHSVCLRESPTVSTQCACPRARTSHVLFSKVFGEANQVQCYWCWDITELFPSWSLHTHTHPFAWLSAKFTPALSLKSEGFFISKTDFLNVIATWGWYATQIHSHTCQHPLPFPWGISWQLHPESVHRLPVSRSPLASHPDRTLVTPTAFLRIMWPGGFRCSIQPNSHCFQHLPTTGKLFSRSVNPWGTVHVINGCLKQ